MEIELAVAVLILFALVFLATIDMAFSQISDVALRRLSSDLEESGGRAKSAEFLRRILENRPRFRFALSSAIQVLLIVFSVLVTLIVYSFYQDKLGLFFVSLVVGLVASIIFRQFIPRLLTWNNPEKKFLGLLPLARPVYGLLANLADPFQLFTKDNSKDNLLVEHTIVPNQQQPTEAEREDAADDIQALIEMGEAEGIIEEEERELIETMVEFGETRAGEIMTPRTEMCAVPIEATVRQARDLIIEEKYSRLPVYRDSIDNIEGVIYVRDLLNVWADGKENQTIETLLRPAFFVPETKSAAELLKNMQSNHYQVAFVVDEYGGVAGLVTVEDILEEIVGEIEDEDTEEEEVIEIIEGGDGYFDVLGSTEIGKIERVFDMEIEDDDFTTIAGLVTSEAGYVPKRGEKLVVRGLDVEVLKADEKRLNLLRLRKHDEMTSESDLKISA
ncbi:MAG: HlyC/CorC family transporter [Acidobacteria bacterium]|jgi:CBS domain containing-hemolysin-like protein|nr:HlyC/CorC family transporter [Acidobacteriota bacterium]